MWRFHGAEYMSYLPNAVWSTSCQKKRVTNDRVNLKFKPQPGRGIIGGKPTSEQTVAFLDALLPSSSPGAIFSVLTR